MTRSYCSLSLFESRPGSRCGEVIYSETGVAGRPRWKGPDRWTGQGLNVLIAATDVQVVYVRHTSCSRHLSRHCHLQYLTYYWDMRPYTPVQHFTITEPLMTTFYEM